MQNFKLKRFNPKTRSKAKTEDAAEPDYHKYLNCEKTKARQDYGEQTRLWLTNKQDYK